MMIEIENLTKIYHLGETEVRALDGVSLNIEKGEMVAIMGPSGSGKSTLMAILGCLDVATSGSYTLDGANVDTLSDNQLAEVRSRKIGFVFQQFNLLARTSALDNVLLPLTYNGVHGPPAARAGRRGAAQGGAGRADAPPPQRAFGRPAAARGHCPGAGERPGHHPGRRAHGRARQQDRR